MGTIEQHAYEAALAAPREADGSVDYELYKSEYLRLRAERDEKLRRDAIASARAMHGWNRITSEEAWLEEVRQADADYDSGGFLIERMGAAHYLDPTLMAVLLAMRRRLIDEHGAATAAELMMIDSALISYYHQLRINGWIGDTARWLESQFFDKPCLSATFEEKYGTNTVRGTTVEIIVQQLVERLMPLLDRSNRMMLRNLKALQARAEPQGPSVSIGTAGQVNVASQQVNTTGKKAGSQHTEPSQEGHQ